MLKYLNSGYDLRRNLEEYLRILVVRILINKNRKERKKFDGKILSRFCIQNSRQKKTTEYVASCLNNVIGYFMSELMS